MGGGGGGGSSDAYQAEQLRIAKEQLELAKSQVVEPEKKLDSAKQASADTAKAMELRRGLASAFSRKSVGSGSAGGSATSGSAGKLGE